MASTSQPIIPIKSFLFHYTKTDAGSLPAFSGSAWRGALGHALKKTVCVVRNTPCNQCLLKNACAYSYVFETPLPANSEKMRKYTAVPHPFVLEPPSSVASPDYSLKINLFGHGERYLPYLIHALQKAGEEGIGAQRKIFDLQTVEDIHPAGDTKTIYTQGQLQTPSTATSPEIPALPPYIEILLHTPLRIKHDNQNIAGQNFNFSAFFSALLRRISMISYFHTDHPLETDFAGLTATAKTIQFSDQRLKWFDWTRYSSRQQTEMNMGGLIGSLNMDTRGLEAFWPYLWLGQWTHTGKATSMGMGAYTIHAASLPTHQQAN
ncbi:MAG: CRISPR system precrRNA processing endoribonuclease RAMP protein Cas6 [Methylococcales bacterium]|nr:CRISPR system precrRNA processing endoribonuclease RAMP protein Cas6 [Methylococcales bacterium]